MINDRSGMLNYEKALYTFLGVRKHLLRDKKYFIYIFSDKLVMAGVGKIHYCARNSKIVIQNT
jgi:hypothetical protein